jgi:flagellar hook assembly protein FlgD
MNPGRHGIQWDGRNVSGAPVGSGVYFVRADAGGKRFDLRLAIIR